MWPGFDSRTRRQMWVEFVVGSRPCSERFFSGYSGFPLSSKTNISKFQLTLKSPERDEPIKYVCDARIKLHRNFRNLCFQVSFSQIFQLAASLFYSIIRNFSYFRPKGCCCFYPVSCVFLLHMGLLMMTYANLVNVWKTSGKAGQQRVNEFIYKHFILQLVVWLPALCRKMGVPYCIVKGKARSVDFYPI